MVLNIYGEVPPDEGLTIKINNEIKILDSMNPHVCISLNEKKRYEIDIKQQLSKSNRTPLFLLLFLLSAVIQGVFNTLLMNTDSKWYRNIKAYCLKAKLFIDLQHDTDIHFTYANSKYDEINQKWMLPTFTVEPNVIKEVNFVSNPCDFSNQYFNYVKRVVSVAIVLILLFSILLHVAIANLNNLAIILTSVVLIGAVLLVILLSISQWIKLKNLYQSFIKQNAVDLE